MAFHRWRYLLVYACLSLILASYVPGRLALGPAQSLLESPHSWVLSETMSGSAEGQQLRLRASGSGPWIASRALQPDPAAEFIRLRVCLGEALAEDSAAVMLASVHQGLLDFNRQYQLYGVAGSAAGECREDAIPRREKDGPAILQLQLRSVDVAARFTTLSITPLRENPVWRALRMLMLATGICLLMPVFRSYVRERPGVLAAAGLLTVAGILFGCCVSVSLKADIYALLTGGRSIEAGASELQELLRRPFPIGGFSLFTGMHAVLFSTATLLLGLVHSRAFTDLMMLAPVTELLQLFVPGRGPGVNDVMVDWGGVLFGLLLVVLLRRSQRIRAFLQHQRIDKNTAGL